MKINHQTRFISGLGYTALSMARRVSKLRELKRVNPDFNYSNNERLRFDVDQIEKFLQELKAV